MSKADWSLAPLATHLTDVPGEWSRPVFWRVVDGIALEAWATDKEYTKVIEHYTYDSDGCISYGDFMTVERPTIKQWSGPQNGLPPVNHGVMFKVKGLHQGYGFVSFYGEEFCVIRNTTPDGGPTEQVCKISEFEVVTPQQLAAEQRETAIRDLADVITHSVGRAGPSINQIAAAVVDAGFKREAV